MNDEDLYGIVYRHSRPAGLASWDPGPASERVLAHVQAVLDDYRAHWPVTNRQVLYRMIARFGYTKADEDRIERVVDRGRRAGFISWDVITDGRLSSDEPFEVRGAAGFWRWAAGHAEEVQLIRQQGQEVFLELWTEAAGLLPQLAAVGHPYGVPVRSDSGFNTSTAHWRMVERAIARADADIAARRTPRRTVVLHVGDHDPDGVTTFVRMRTDVEKMAKDQERSGLVEVVRTALLPSQIERHRVTGELEGATPAEVEAFRRKAKRRGGWEGPAAQVEALTPAQLATEVRGTIERLLDLDVLSAVVAREGALRGALADELERLAAEGA